MTSCPTLPCYHFHVRWGSPCWWVASCCHWEPWERGGKSPGAGGWCGTGHWECIWQRRTWILEGRSWETPHSPHIMARLCNTYIFLWSKLGGTGANICLYARESTWRTRPRCGLEFPDRWGTKVAAAVMMKSISLDDLQLQRDPVKRRMLKVAE